jgi:hypothetical protein
MTERPPDGEQPPKDDEVPAGGANPEQIGADLFQRLDTLDDRLRRSQEKMIALLDRKLNGDTSLEGRGAGDQQTGRGSPDPEHSRWVPPTEAAAAGQGPVPAGPDIRADDEVAEPIGAEDPMDAWFAVGGRHAPAGPAAASGVSADDGTTTSDPATAGSASPAPVGPRAGDEIPEIVPSRRPAWQSNAITAVVAAIVIVVALFLVGLF